MRRPVQVRVTDALRQVIDQSGQNRSNAMLALLLVGAHHAGMDISEAQADAWNALADPELDGGLRQALQRAIGQPMTARTVPVSAPPTLKRALEQNKERPEGDGYPDSDDPLLDSGFTFDD